MNGRINTTLGFWSLPGGFSRTCIGSVVGFACAAWVAAASAAVTDYAVSRTVSTTQTSNAPPAGPETWHLLALVVTDVPDEVVTATVDFTRPPATSYGLSQAIATLYQYNSAFYPSEAAFLADYPVTSYTLTVDLGAGPATGSVSLPQDLYCADIPYFTGDTYDRLQNYDVSQPFTLNFNGFTINPGTTVGAIQLVVVEDNGPSAVISVSLDPSETSYEIPAGTLNPASSYSIGLTYFNVLLTPNAGFGTATSGAEYYRSTTAYFTTRPSTPDCCRGDMNNDNVIDGDDVQGFVDALLAGQPCP